MSTEFSGRPFLHEADDDESDESLPLRELARLAGHVCSDCMKELSARHGVFSIVLGFKNAPRCLPCLSRQLGRVETELGEQLVAHIHRRECYLKAWRVAEARDSARPTDCESNVPETRPKQLENHSATSSEWDAGDLGCGELVMGLRLRLNGMAPGAILKLRATDPAAPEDLPAWCRMSGHTLVTIQHPTYFIQRKGA